ncbi:DUF6493 family protein [Planomonospora venezuelensis]|uniref:DUF7824 domain-containing protein n=1 Tax=Planomonospora venezuelensis TaxID=1999 RepID=A0A841CW25_PLAVE|nr:DUF6493 family protein [Planomonospora venezuelensis]MBB5961509.1 hypothetical protein [Planomonospora venezuelensis]GIM98653.1 hypothetical protein Pve01_03120 [Planomonospora venezuelensis]
MQSKDVQPPAWDRVRKLIDAGDSAGVAAAVAVLDPAGRREVARELPGYVEVARDRAERAMADHEAAVERRRRARQDEVDRLRAAGRLSEEQHREAWAATWYDDWRTWPVIPDWAGPMRVAGAGVIGGAAAAAAWIDRRELGEWDLAGGTASGGDEPLLAAISARPVPFQAELAVRLALRVRGGRRRRARSLDGTLPLALTLLRRTGAAPPEHDPLVVGWVSRGGRLGELRADPLLDHLLPRIFEAEGVGRALRGERPARAGAASWLGALRALAAEGRVDRAFLLDGCRRRFLRGGEGPDLRFFAHLHELLDPAPAEIEPHAVDYLRLLPAAPGPVAEPALKHLRRLTGLDPTDVAEALEGLLFRAEGGLARAGLSWWEETVRQAPGPVDELAPALAVAFGHQVWAVQERAARLAIRHAGRFTPRGAELLRAGAEAVPPALRHRLVAALGGEAVEEPEAGPGPGPGPGKKTPEEVSGDASGDVFAPRTLPAPARPLPVAEPPDTPAYLADLYLRDDRQAGERRLAAFVRLAVRDRDALRARLAPLVASQERRLHSREWKDPGDWMIALAAELVRPGWVDATRHTALTDRARRANGLPPATGELDRLPRRTDTSPLHRFVLRRHAEVLTALRAGALPPLLLATPSLSNGLLDPAELVSRMEALEAAGAVPLPADFQQALLRLPRRVDPAVTARATALRSPEGRRAARWLAEGGLPDPVVRVAWPEGDDGPGTRVWMTSTVRAEPTGLPLLDELLAEQPRHVSPVTGGHLGGLMEWWPAVLPSHREVVAAHLVPHQPVPPWSSAMDSLRLADLAAAEGPAGRAVAVLLAHRIFPHPLARDGIGSALRALRGMAATDELPAEELGRELAQRVLRGEITLRLLVDRVEREAANGAACAMWGVVAAALPLLLPARGSRPTGVHTDLVALAARLAPWSRTREEIPALSAFAARKGSSRILTHARALRDHLASGGASPVQAVRDHRDGSCPS